MTTAAKVRRSLDATNLVAALLHVIAWIVLIGGVSGALLLWDAYEDAQRALGAESPFNSFGIGIVVALVFQVLIFFALLTALAVGLSELRRIRQNTTRGQGS
jgi:hypothetical protein